MQPDPEAVLAELRAKSAAKRKQQEEEDLQKKLVERRKARNQKLKDLVRDAASYPSLDALEDAFWQAGPGSVVSSRDWELHKFIAACRKVRLAASK